MRIEISSGGVGGVAVSELQRDLSKYIDNATSVIACFKTVKGSTSGLNGGVGNLEGALSSVDSRVQSEETKLQEAKNIQKRIDGFIDLATRVDSSVSEKVNKNKNELYRVNPWLKPTTSVEEEIPWYEQAWNWLCGTGETIADGAKQVWNWVSDTAVKAWNGIVEFYQEHKKVIDTILIVIGTVASIAAVIATGGLALVPLLTAIGASAGIATAISATVAIVAVVSTVGSSILNIVDIWGEIDNSAFNAWQRRLGLVSVISNGVYSIGAIYNAVNHYSTSDIYNYVKKSYANDGITYGGSYQDVFKTSDSSLYQVHECPSFKVTGDQYRKYAPSIRMEIADHARTGSFGSSKQAMQYRAQQLAYMKDGDFTAAFKMDIADLKQFGFKYAKEIEDMKKYAKIFKMTRGMR